MKLVFRLHGKKNWQRWCTAMGKYLNGQCYAMGKYLNGQCYDRVTINKLCKEPDCTNARARAR